MPKRSPSEDSTCLLDDCECKKMASPHSIATTDAATVYLAGSSHVIKKVNTMHHMGFKVKKDKELATEVVMIDRLKKNPAPASNKLAT
eukprot:2880772-Amphidinium_carterae.2